MSVRLRLVLAWVLLTASLFGWPLSAVTFAKHEPQFILGLSWLAIILTAIDLLATTDVRKQEEDKED
jgi:hypothetical protein